jgi:hypothetical protein
MVLSNSLSYLILLLATLASGEPACPQSCETCDPELGCIKYKEAPSSEATIRHLSGASCPDLCASCDSDGICQTCKLNTVQTSGSCVCASGYFKTGMQCSPCNPLCQTCDPATGCSQCKPNAGSETSDCLCESGYYQDSGSCVACSDTLCDVCRSSTCTQCKSKASNTSDSLVTQATMN